VRRRNPFAERLLGSAIAGVVIDCQNMAEGCTARDLIAKIGEHEKICVYREVRCPARHRGACNWAGPLAKMLLHTIDGKCAQIVKSREDDRPFASVIGDFNTANMTAFGRRAMTHWKPVLLISRQCIRLFAYLVMYRDESGNWIVYLRSYASQEGLDRLSTTIVIRRPSSAEAFKAPEDGGGGGSGGGKGGPPQRLRIALRETKRHHHHHHRHRKRATGSRLPEESCLTSCPIKR